MASEGNVSQYVGRLIDICAYTGQDDTKEVLLSPAFFSSVCTGTQKLAQAWLIEFLTIPGSMPLAPDRGSSFAYALMSGRLRTTQDVEQSFYAAAKEVELTLKRLETTSTPTDEQIVSAGLVSAAIGGDSLSLRINITSVAGSSRQVILPIPVNTR